MGNNIHAIFDEFKIYFPSISKTAIGYREWSPEEIEVRLNDGGRAIYNFTTQSARFLSPDITDEELARLKLASNLKVYLSLRKMTLLELAEKTEISRQTLSKYFNSESFPSVYNARKIARALECTMDELMGLDTYFE